MIILLVTVITLLFSRSLDCSQLLTDQPNWFAGYRTPRSLASKEAWNAAQHYSLKFIGRTSRVLLPSGVAWTLIDLYLYFHISEDSQGFYSFLPQMIIIAGDIIWLFLSTEHYLKNHFK